MLLSRAPCAPPRMLQSGVWRAPLGGSSLGAPCVLTGSPGMILSRAHCIAWMVQSRAIFLPLHLLAPGCSNPGRLSLYPGCSNPGCCGTRMLQSWAPRAAPPPPPPPPPPILGGSRAPRPIGHLYVPPSLHLRRCLVSSSSWRPPPPPWSHPSTLTLAVSCSVFAPWGVPCVHRRPLLSPPSLPRPVSPAKL